VPCMSTMHGAMWTVGHGMCCQCRRRAA